MKLDKQFNLQFFAHGADEGDEAENDSKESAIREAEKRILEQLGFQSLEELKEKLGISSDTETTDETVEETENISDEVVEDSEEQVADNIDEIDSNTETEEIIATEVADETIPEEVIEPEPTEDIEALKQEVQELRAYKIIHGLNVLKDYQDDVIAIATSKGGVTKEVVLEILKRHPYWKASNNVPNIGTTIGETDVPPIDEREQARKLYPSLKK